jgi:chromosome partitioning protein
MNDAAIIFAADAARWYQDFTFWGSFLTALSILVGAAWFLAWHRYRERLRRWMEERDRQLREARAENKKLKSARGPERDQLKRRFAVARRLLKETCDEKDQLTAKLDEYRAESERLDRNLQVAEQLHGRTWHVKPADDAPRFVPLANRRTPVVAVLNLKGGVGKTTLAANLAAAWARDGRRVLLIDLDLQASLTGLFLAAEELHRLADNRRLIQHYFDLAAAGERPKFLDFIHHCSEHRVELVGSADTLAYAELALTMRWFRSPGRGDVRLLLREALHGGGHAREYDLVLIDCPPLMNVSCVNALAAADYLLAPVMPTNLAADRVRPMLAWVKALRRNLNHDLKVIGVVANRVAQATGMRAVEKNLWTSLRDQCRDAWGEEVYLCKAFIPQRVDVRDAESERRPLKSTDEAFAFFERLARELAARLPQPTAARATS